MGRDLSNTGEGLKWDFIIVHETGHEWFGNNITTRDIADMWVHESFTNYSEALFMDYWFGTAHGNIYETGLRRNILNDIPIIGPYGVNEEGSGDMYYKGSNMLHTIRQIVDNDSVFRGMLRGLNSRFYHTTVTTAEIEQYMSEYLHMDLKPIFDQYLRTTDIPVLQLRKKGKHLRYRWVDCVDGFHMKVRLNDLGWIQPTRKWQKVSYSGKNKPVVDSNFYIVVH